MNIDYPTPADKEALRSLWKEAFSDTDEFLDDFEATAFSQKRCRCVRLDGEICAALYWFDCSYRGGRVAYLYAVATRAAYRGRGVCTALMKDTLALLCSLGYSFCVLVPGSEELFAFYARLGFKVCGYVRELSASAEKTGAELRKISAEEYARLRRELLPEEAILQEGENIDFLCRSAALYAGEGLLLAAVREGDTLRGIELLGNVDEAEKIVNTLGCRKGYFRTVGKEKKFAMGHPLCEDIASDNIYFGLAFD